MSDDDYSSKDYVEVVDQEPTKEREVRVEERERVTFLAEDRLEPEERRELEDRALEGANEAEIYEESWSPSHDADLDEIHDYIDHRLDEDRTEAPSTRDRSTSSAGRLRPGETERLRRAIPGQILSQELRYRTDSGSVVRVEYRAKDGDVQTTLVSIAPDKVRFIDDIRSEVDDQDIEVGDLDLEPPAPPGESARSRTRTRAEPEPAQQTEPKPEPDEAEEPEETEAEEADELEQELEEVAEPEPDEPEEPEQTFSEEDLELAEELGIPPEELAGITEEEEDDDSGGLGGMFGGSDKDEGESEGSGGGLGGMFGGSDDEDTDEAEDDEGGGGLGGMFGGSDDEPEEAEDEDAESGGGLGGLLGGSGGDEEDADEADEDDEDDEGGGGLKDKMPFG